MPAMVLAPIILILGVLAMFGGIFVASMCMESLPFLVRLVEKDRSLGWIVKALLTIIAIPCMFVLLGLAGFGLSWLAGVVMSATSTPQEAFQEAFGSLPQGITLEHSKHIIREDQTIWLHFTGNRESIVTFLGYLRDHKGYTQHRGSCRPGRSAPRWWNPSSLGENGHLYTYADEYWTIDICMNATLTEGLCYAHERWL